MTKFDMSAAWADATAMLAANKEAVLVLGGLLIAVPYAGLFVMISQSGLLEQFRQDMAMAEVLGLLGPVLWVALAVYLVTQVGSLAITRLLLAQGGTTVGEALRFSVAFVLVAIAAQLIVTVILQLLQLGADALFAGSAGIAALVGLAITIASLYINSGRLLTVVPIIAAQRIANPIAALRDSWALTRGNGWRIALFFFLTILLLVIAAGLVLLLLALVLFALPTEAGGPLLWIPAGFILACVSVVAVAIAAAVYRQLGGADAALADEFS